MALLYQAYQNHMDMTEPWRHGAAAALRYLNLLPRDSRPGRSAGSPPRSNWSPVRRLTYARPAYGIDSVMVGNREVPVGEEVTFRTPFGSLLHFKKEIAPEQPRVLLVAPMSGHFATLLRSTVKTLLQDHDVYITDWHNPRDIPASDGRFGLDDYTEHLITFLGQLGPRPHMVAICQPSVSALAAAAIMCEDDNPARPRNADLDGGPDRHPHPADQGQRIRQEQADQVVRGQSDRLRAVSVQGRVPQASIPASCSSPAFVIDEPRAPPQAASSTSANHLAKGEVEKAEVIKTFYDEYFAVMDLPAEFYIETVRDVFQEHLLPQGKLTYRGRPVNPARVRRIGLMTVEGERDDICSIGQTLAAQELCTGVRAYRRVHHMQAGVGHYGVFSGGEVEQRDLSAAAGFRSRQFLTAARLPAQVSHHDQDATFRSSRMLGGRHVAR